MGGIRASGFRKTESSSLVEVVENKPEGLARRRRHCRCSSAWEPGQLGVVAGRFALAAL